MKKDKITHYEATEKYDSIKIAVKTAHIEIKESCTQKTEIELCESKRFAHSVKLDGGILTICRAKSKWYSYLLPSFKFPRITLYLPKKELSELNIGCATGKIHIAGLSAKNLTVTCGTGKITLLNVLVENKINIQTNTGKVEFDQSDASEIFVKTNTGKVYGNLLSDKAFVIRCKTGKISIPKTFGSNKFEIISNTGSIDFKIKER